MTTVHDFAPAFGARRWRPNANGWMVGRAPAKRGARPVYWLGPDEGVGLSATPDLSLATDALVWATADQAHAALSRVFQAELDYYIHGFRLVRVVDGRPDRLAPQKESAR